MMDTKLGNAIKEKLNINCIFSHNVMELMRGLRSQMSELVSFPLHCFQKETREH